MRMSSSYLNWRPLKRWLAVAAAVLGVPMLQGRLAAQSWYNNGWSNRKAITINHTKVSGGSSLTAFPVLTSVTGDANLKTVANGGSVGKSDGTDILFTAADGITKLNHELESYSAATGATVAWVRIPSLSASIDTVVYVYYGNAAAADQQNKTGVWDSNYKVVNHFKDASGTLTDSTQYANHGTISGGAALTPNGVAGGAYSFDGISGLMTIPYNSSWNGSFNNYSVQLWLKLGTVQDYHGGAGDWDLE